MGTMEHRQLWQRLRDLARMCEARDASLIEDAVSKLLSLEGQCSDASRTCAALQDRAEKAERQNDDHAAYIVGIERELAAAKVSLSESVSKETYEAAVKGRADFREALRESRDYAVSTQAMLVRISDRAHLAALYRYKDRIHNGNLEFATEQVRDFLKTPKTITEEVHHVDGIGEVRVREVRSENAVGPISDRGPWRAEIAHPQNRNHGWAVVSDDFEHDVVLELSGDFESDEQKRAYAEWLTTCLNREARTDSEGVEDLIESYPTPQEMAEELSYRIGESLELRKALEDAEERTLPETAAQRIRELERDLATVNARLVAAQNPESSQVRVEAPVLVCPDRDGACPTADKCRADGCQYKGPPL